MTRTGSYVGPATIRTLSWLIALVGLVAAIAGPLYAVAGTARAGDAVTVTVELSAPGAIEPPQVRGLPAGAQVEALDGAQVQLSAPGATVLEQLLSRGDAALLGLAIGAAALLLRPVLSSVAAGRAFGGGNARRLAQLAAVVVLAGEVGPLLPQLAAIAVLDRLQLIEPDSPFLVQLRFSLGPVLLLGALLLVLAEAFRQGERLSSDVEGLV